MNHAAVARAGKHPNLWQRLEHEYIIPTRRERMSDRTPHDPAAYDDYIRVVDGYTPLRSFDRTSLSTSETPSGS